VQVQFYQLTHTRQAVRTNTKLFSKRNSAHYPIPPPPHFHFLPLSNYIFTYFLHLSSLFLSPSRISAFRVTSPLLFYIKKKNKKLFVCIFFLTSTVCSVCNSSIAFFDIPRELYVNILVQIQSLPNTVHCSPTTNKSNFVSLSVRYLFKNLPSQQYSAVPTFLLFAYIAK
jgi:hypothetical protein